MPDHDDLWIAATLQSADGYRKMIDAAIAQLTDSELHRSPSGGANSVAVILRHLGGNLQSRWEDFLDSDGEKPTRNRDMEFEPWEGDRKSLLQFFDTGWQRLIEAVSGLTPADLERTVQIRGEPHSVPQAIVRSLAHIAYHVGQIMNIAREVHDGPWQWLTIPPGKSQQHNESTWGSARSRGVAGEES